MRQFPCKQKRRKDNENKTQVKVLVNSARTRNGACTRLNGSHIVEFPEAHVFTVAAILECCMQLGLIPTNNGYGKLFNNLSISAQITDQNGTPVYASATSTPLTAEEFALKSGSRLKEHIVMHKMKIQGGYGIWQVDLAELDRLNEELEEAKEGLSEETELIIKKKSKIILLVDVNIL